MNTYYSYSRGYVIYSLYIRYIFSNCFFREISLDTGATLMTDSSSLQWKQFERKIVESIRSFGNRIRGSSDDYGIDNYLQSILLLRLFFFLFFSFLSYCIACTCCKTGYAKSSPNIRRLSFLWQKLCNIVYRKRNNNI